MRSIGGFGLERWTRQMGTQHNTRHILHIAQKGSSLHDMSIPFRGHNFVSIAHMNSRRVPMQHQHSRATLESYPNARNIMAKELRRKLYPLDNDPLR